MARYRKIDPRVWDDEKFVHLPTLDKLIALYVVTSQSNRIGLFRFSRGLALEHLGMDPETFDKGFGNVCRTLNWSFDEGRRVLFIPTWWKYNAPENPNVLKGCLQDLHEVPQTPLMAKFADATEYLPSTFLQTFREGLPKRTRNQEQEQKQEERESATADAGGAANADKPGGTDTTADPAEPTRSAEAGKAAASTSGRGAKATGQPRPAKVNAKAAGTGPEHAEFRDYFRGRWKALYGADYAWKHGRDDAHAKWVLDLCGRTPAGSAEARRIVDRFAADDDPWLVERRHEISLLVSRINRYRGVNGNSVVTAAGYDRWNPPPEGLDREEAFRRLRAGGDPNDDDA